MKKLLLKSKVFIRRPWTGNDRRRKYYYKWTLSPQSGDEICTHFRRHQNYPKIIPSKWMQQDEMIKQL